MKRVWKPKAPTAYATVPRLLPNGGTVLVTGSGPSLTQADVNLARAHVDASIAVNDSYKLIPDATVLYAGDKHWWGWHEGAAVAHTVGAVKYPAFTGQFRFTLWRTPWYPAVQILRRGPQTGLSLDPASVALGLNSVYQAMNIAVHLGASRIVLLGVDMQGGHFFGNHPNGSAPPFAFCLKRFDTLVAPMKAAGVEVLNCTRKTALKAFSCVPLEDALGIREQVAV